LRHIDIEAALDEEKCDPMSTKVIMPQMGESIFEGTITKWLKKVGEKIERDEPLFEISTDKVDSEIPSPAAGIVGQILVPEGKTVQINTVVAIIEGGAAPEVRKAAGQEPDALVPVITAAAPAAADVRERPAASFAAVADIPKARSAPAPQPAPTPKVQPRDIRTSPLVRRLAREHGIDLAEIRGTGLEGRITKQDVQNYLDQRTEPVPSRPAAVPPAVVIKEAPPAAEPALTQPRGEAVKTIPAPAEPSRFFGETEAVPMTPMRKAIAEHMVMSKHTSAHVNTVFEVDMTAIVKLRDKHKDEFEKREGVKLTYTPFFVKALVDTVREFPIFNSSVSGDSIVYKKPVNVGIAVALDTGLIVPVVKDAHLKSFSGIALAIHDLATRARTRRLRPDEVQNGTISITNPGIYGSLFGTPIISQPQVAILGIGGIEKRPIVIDDAIAIRSMVYLSLTFDHRVIDGAVADQFMASLKQRLQSWAQWTD
jgi:2-oxoglutarate dehydrogenase E2 component (dihydrolipoamide succinyltransferase)